MCNSNAIRKRTGTFEDKAASLAVEHPVDTILKDAKLAVPSGLWHIVYSHPGYGTLCIHKSLRP